MNKLKPAQIGIIITTLITAVVHFSLGDPLFILNGLGYLALLAVYFLPVAIFQRWHGIIRWVFAGYVLLTIILYFVFHADGSWQQDGMGLITKVIEVILLLLLIFDRPAQSTDQNETG